jgi:hypothetical protein
MFARPRSARTTIVSTVSTALSPLIVIIAVTPAILIHDGTAIYGLLLALVAVGVAVTASRIPAGEAAYLHRVILTPAILTAIPAAWMLVQMVPLPIHALANPIWDSTATALGLPMTGAITIDVGATALAFSRYTLVLGILLLAMLTATDRRQAKWLLYALTAATTTISLMFLCSKFFNFAFLNALQDPTTRADALDAVAFGLILSISTGNRIYERQEMRRSEAARVNLRRGFALSAASFILCLTALFLGRSRMATFAGLYGVSGVVAIALIRRLTLGRWGLMALAAVAIVGFIGIVATSSGVQESDLTIALASQDHGATIVAQRIVSDAPLPGTGAGTYPALVPIYRTPDESESQSVVPTAAAAISIELGRPMLWYTFIGLAIGVLLLLRGALRRGRDSFYPATGTGCLIASLLLMLGNAGLLGAASASLAAATVGLAIGQSQSRQA